MGNYNETTRFVQDEGDINEYKYNKTTRHDTMFINTVKSFELTAIGLCSAIYEPAFAHLTITDVETSSLILEQRITIDVNKNKLDSYYPLDKSVRIIKNKNYKLQVTVEGGGTHCYNIASHYATLGDIIIEITKHLSYSMSTVHTTGTDTNFSRSGHKRVSKSEADLDSLNGADGKRKNNKKKTTQPMTLPSIEEDVSSDKFDKRDKKKKTLQPGSLTYVDEDETADKSNRRDNKKKTAQFGSLVNTEEDELPEKAGRRGSRLKTAEFMEDTLNAKRFGKRTMTNSSDREQTNHGEQKHSRRNNQITGFSLSYSRSYCCTSK